jgi:hypothetical protein
MAGSRASQILSLAVRCVTYALRRQPVNLSSGALVGQAADRYNQAMRRPMRLGLAIAILLIAIFAAYSAVWFVIAGRLEDGVVQWAGSLRAQNLDLSWRTIRVGGFPLALSVTLSGARLRNLATTAPNGEVQAPLLSGTARLWNLRVWQLTASDGLSGTAHLAGDAVATLSARAASVSVAVPDDGGATLWLGLTEPAADAGVHLAAREADLWLVLPSHMPQTHTEPAMGLAADVRGLSLPAAPAPFGATVDEIALGITVMGAIPAAPPRRAADVWRDSGGTLELDHLALRWGSVRVTGSGTLALDPDLQPIGGFSGTIGGYDELLKGLVAAGRLRPGDARLAGFALAMLAKTGPDGRKEIATSFTIQNGEMYLGPAKLGKAPRITWE